MTTAYERRVERLREHVLSQNKQEEKPIEEMTVEELKEKAKGKGLEGYTKLKKDELIKLLTEGE